MKEKCLQWYASQIQLPAIIHPLIQQVQSDLLPVAARAPRIIDRDQLIVNYGLYTSIGKPFQIDKFTSLHIPSEFEMIDLLPSVRGKLENLDIEQADIEYCLARLKDHRGDVVRTFHELEYIVSYLREKYS